MSGFAAALGWVLASAVLAVAAGAVLRAGELHWLTRFLLGVVPVVPIVIYFVSLFRGLNRLDELQRRILLEGLLVAFGGTGILAMTYGLLAKASVVPNLPASRGWPFLWIAMFLLWGAGSLRASRRYQ